MENVQRETTGDPFLTVVGKWSSDFGVRRSGIRQWSGDLSYWGGVSDWGNDFGDNWSGGDYGFLDDWALSVDDSVESVDRVGGVVNGSSGAVWFGQRVRSLDDVSLSRFFLRFAVSGQSVLNVIGVAVAWIWVVVGVDDGFSEGWSSGVGNWSVSYRGGISNRGVGDWSSVG